MYCTCTVSSSNAVYHISGAGIYADRATPQYDDLPIANNGLVLSSTSGILVTFISNSSQLGVGTITLSTPSTTLSNGDNTNVWRVYAPQNRPGTLRIGTRSSSSFPASSQGIFTATIPDSNNNIFVFNVGLYPNGFDGELLLLVIFKYIPLPAVPLSLSLSPYNSGSHHFQPDLQSCTSYSDL